MKPILEAFRFLTVFPLGSSADAGGAQALARATAFFPLVGAVQGGLLVGGDWLFSMVLPTGVVSGLLLALLVLTNNGFHLDGLADTLDGMAAGGGREERLRVMRKSDIGPMGVVGLVIILLIKFLAIASLTGWLRWPVLFLFPVMGRFAIVPMAAWSVYARASDGLGSAFCETPQRAFAAALAITLLLSVPLLGVRALVITGLMLVMVYCCSRYFNKKFGGVTGDIFGFQSEVSEVAFLLLVLISVG